MPGGVKGALVLLIFPIEILSNFLRLISADRAAVGEPTCRSHADRVHGRRARRACRLAARVLVPAAGRDRDLPVPRPSLISQLLPAFIFAILTAIYLGRRSRATSKRGYRAMQFLHLLSAFHPLLVSTPVIKESQDAGRAIALGVGAGGGAAGAGAASERCSTLRSRPRPGSPSCVRRSSATIGSVSRSPRHPSSTALSAASSPSSCRPRCSCNPTRLLSGSS